MKKDGNQPASIAGKKVEALTNKNTLGLLLVLLFVSGVTAANTYWNILDTRLLPVVDEYAEKIFNLADALETQHFYEYPRAFYWATIGPRTPLYQMMAAPFVIFVERSTDAMLLVNAFFLLVLGVATYRIGTISGGVRVGCLAALMVTTFPLINDLAKIVRPHTILPAVSALALWAMLIMMQRRTVASVWVVIMAMLFVFGTHPSGFLLLSIPFAGASLYSILTLPSHSNSDQESWYSWLWRKLKKPIFTKGVFPGCLLILFLLSVWMMLKWEQYIGMEEVMYKYFQVPMFYLESILYLQISPVIMITSLLGVLLTIVRLSGKQWKYDYQIFFVFVLVAMLITSHQTHGDLSWHTSSGMLPVFAVLAAIAFDYFFGLLGELGSRVIRNTLQTFFLCMFAWVITANYLVSGWGMKNDLLQVASIHMPFDPDVFNPKYPVTGDWKVKKILNKIFKSDLNCHRFQCKLTLVSHRQTYYNDEAFSYSMVQYFPKVSMLKSEDYYPKRSLIIRRMGRGEGGYADWLKADYLLFLYPTQREEKYNDWSISADEREQGIVEFLQKSILDEESQYEKLYEAEIPNGKYVVLLKRKRDVSVGLMRDIVVGLNVSASLKELFLDALDE